MATGTGFTPGEWGQVHCVQNVGWYRFRLGVFEGMVISITATRASTQMLIRPKSPA